jgi:hypothetical protein
MKPAPSHLKAMEKKISISGLVEVLREEGIDAVRYALWDATSYTATADRSFQSTERTTTRLLR